MSIASGIDVNLLALVVSIASVLGVYSLFGFAGIIVIQVLFVVTVGGFLFYTVSLPRIGGCWR